MKRVIFVSLCFLVLGLVGCTSCKPINDSVDTSYVKQLEDSIARLNGTIDTLNIAVVTYESYLVAFSNQSIRHIDRIDSLNDSIKKLNERPLMTKAQFLDLYKYERLLKYYKICKNNPTQWKYYRGWSTRVFEE